MTAQSESFWAADGGGSGCRLALVHGGQRYEYRTGPANVTSDYEVAENSIRIGMEGLAQAAGLTLEALQGLPCYLGLAGLQSDVVRRRLAQGLGTQNGWFDEDCRPAVVGALGGRDGAVAAAGTGSYIARLSGSSVQSIGGHGAILGDEGSAAWIGKTALTYALHAEDGLRPHSPLSRALLDQFGAGRQGLITFAAEARPVDFGALAPQVTRGAQDGDDIACAIMSAGAEYIVRGLGALGVGADEPLCLIGGVGPSYRPYLPGAVQSRIVAPVASALDGAVALARGLARGQKGTAIWD